MSCPSRASPTIRRRSSSLGRGPLVERARRVDERHRLVELEAVLLLAAHLEPQVLSFGRVACEQSLAHGAREDLGEQVQVRVDRLRPQRLHRAPAPVDQRLADRQGCLDPAVLGELAVEVGLDVAARQFAHGDVTEVRQQVDLELALHVSQAVRAQPLSDLALVVLVGELRDRRDFALDVVGLQRRAPGPGENLPRRVARPRGFEPLTFGSVEGGPSGPVCRVFIENSLHSKGFRGGHERTARAMRRRDLLPPCSHPCSHRSPDRSRASASPCGLWRGWRARTRRTRRGRRCGCVQRLVQPASNPRWLSQSGRES